MRVSGFKTCPAFHYTRRMPAYRFRPQWIPTLCCLVLGCVLVALGRWQWARAEEKQILQDEQRMARGAPAQFYDGTTVPGSQAISQELPVWVTGVLDSEHSFMLDNQILDARPGFDLLTPLHLGENRWMIVDRGWMPWDAARHMPELPVPRIEQLTLYGSVYLPSEKQRVLKADDYTSPSWPFLIQKFDFPAMQHVLSGQSPDMKLAPFVLRLNPDQVVERGEQLPRRWQWLGMGPEKHRAYAFQWFGMAIALMILYLVFSSRTSPHD